MGVGDVTVAEMPRTTGPARAHTPVGPVAVMQKPGFWKKPGFFSYRARK